MYLSLWFSSQMHISVEHPHAFRPLLFDESSLITRLESWGLRKILTIMRLPCNRTGVNCEGEKSLHIEAVFPIHAISLLVQEAHAWHLPSGGGQFSFPSEKWICNFQLYFKRNLKDPLLVCRYLNLIHSDRNWTDATLKGKPPPQKQKRGRCYKQTWAKGSLWFSHEKVTRGVRALADTFLEASSLGRQEALLQMCAGSMAALLVTHPCQFPGLDTETG